MTLHDRVPTVDDTHLTPPPLGVTVFGCAWDEAVAVRKAAPLLGVVPTITEAAVSPQTAHLAEGTRCISVGHATRVDAPVLDALRAAGVAYLSTRSIGCDHIDVAYAERIGLTVENVAYAPDGVADYTLMLTLMALRHAKATLRRVDLHDYRLHEVRGVELRDLTVGVVGAGRIGGAVIERLRGFGCRILVTDSRRAVDAEYVPLDELLVRSDIVTLHVPLTDATRHLLDRRRIDRLKPGAFVVNTARGGLLDTAALVDALESGALGGAALDVIEGEEGVFYTDRRAAPIDDATLLRLHRLPNVVITPHSAFSTDRVVADTVENSLRNCLAFGRGAA